MLLVTIGRCQREQVALWNILSIQQLPLDLGPPAALDTPRMASFPISRIVPEPNRCPVSLPHCGAGLPFLLACPDCTQTHAGSGIRENSAGWLTEFSRIPLPCEILVTLRSAGREPVGRR